MSTNRHAIIRYNALDKCFSNFGRKFYFEDLFDEVNDALFDFDNKCTGIKTRQLRDDIRFMKSEAGYSAPIETYYDGERGRKAYYRYDDKKFSIHNMPLNETEARYLKSALAILQRFEGAEQFEWLSEIGPLLEDNFGLKDQDKKIISYDDNVDYTGYENLKPLFNAILNKRVLQINYVPFNKNSFSITFHPYFLKQYNKRWFVIGFNQDFDNRKWVMALDRIKTIEGNDEKYISDNTDWDDYFFDVIGPTVKEGIALEIELIFSEEQAKYIETKPIHPTQKSKYLENGKLQVRLKLIPNRELEMILLSYGEKVEVIKPNFLRNIIEKRLKSALKCYK